MKYELASVKVSIGSEFVKVEVLGHDEVEVRISLPEEHESPVKIEFEGLADMGISTMSFE